MFTNHITLMSNHRMEVSARDVSSHGSVYQARILALGRLGFETVSRRVLERLGLVSALSLERLEAYNVSRDLLSISGDVSAIRFFH